MFRRLGLFVGFVITIAAAGGSQAFAARSTAITVDPHTGNDISYPQCGKSISASQAFGIVGVTGGTAATTNSCLDSQLSWASRLNGSNPNQPKIQLYVNTANPGEVLETYKVTTWPVNNTDIRGNDSLNTTDPAKTNPYGACETTAGNYNGYTNDMACSWQYGWNRGVESVDQRFKPAAQKAGVSTNPTDYRWWLDVETTNSWQTAGTAEAYARNTASLEGMRQFYDSEGISYVGLYSTSYQWGQVTGKTLSNSNTGSNLKSLPSWIAGASSATDAKKRCNTLSGITGGPVIMNQYISRNLDYDYSCI